MTIARHTTFNLAGALVPLALALATIPLYIHTLGEARYGVLALAWLLLGYFGLFDLGLGPAAAQRIAMLRDGLDQERSTVFWTALAINACLGLVGALLIWPLASYAAANISVDEALRGELLSSVPLLAMAVPVVTVSGVLTGSLQGRAQFFELNAVTVLSSTLAQLLPLAVALLSGPNLPALIAAVLSARVLAVAALYWRCVHHVPLRAPVVSREHARGLITFGGWVTISSVVGPVMVMADRFAIATMLGPKAVAYYTVPMQVTERAVVFPSSLASALFPRLASGTPQEQARLMPAAMLAVLSAISPFAVFGIMIISPWLGWWIDSDFAQYAGTPGQLLVVAFWFNSCAQLPFWQLRAVARPDITAKCHLGEVVPYLLLLALGLHFGGLGGVAAAFLLRTAADCWLLMHFADLWRSTGGALLRQLAPIAAALVIASITAAGSPLWWAALALLMTLSAALSWFDSPELVRKRITEARLKLLRLR